MGHAPGTPSQRPRAWDGVSRNRRVQSRAARWARPRANELAPKVPCGRTAEQGQRELELFAKDRDRALNTGLPTGGEGPVERPSDEGARRAEREAFHEEREQRQQELTRLQQSVSEHARELAVLEEVLEATTARPHDDEQVIRVAGVASPPSG